LIDICQYSNFLGKVSVKLFDFNLKHRTEFAFNFFYELVNNKIGLKHQVGFVKKAFANKNIQQKLEEFNPDLVISTHFFAGNIIDYYNRLGVINCKIVTVLTDYALHSFWIKTHRFYDAYIVANEIVKNELIEKGIDKKRIYSYGLPIDQKKYLNLQSKEEIINKYNLNINFKTYLMFGGGGAGAMYYYEYFKVLAKQKYPINIIFVSGKNQKLEAKAKAYVQKEKLENVKVLGFVKNVFSLMQLANYVITKPGAATITECMIMKTPMIIIPGYGGQEKYNGRFVVSKKFGYKVRGTLFFKRLVKKTINNDNLEEKFRSNLEKLESNESTKKIMALCDKMLKENK